jgi:hypothetical protein
MGKREYSMTSFDGRVSKSCRTTAIDQDVSVGESGIATVGTEASAATQDAGGKTIAIPLRLA